MNCVKRKCIPLDFGLWFIIMFILLYEKQKLNFTQMSKDKGSVAKGHYKRTD